MPKSTTCTWHFHGTPQAQELQHDTGILPSLHPGIKLMQFSWKGKVGESVVAQGEGRKKENAMAFVMSVTQGQQKPSGGAQKVLPMGKGTTTSQIPPNLCSALDGLPLPRSSHSCWYTKPKLLFVRSNHSFLITSATDKKNLLVFTLQQSFYLFAHCCCVNLSFLQIKKKKKITVP